LLFPGEVALAGVDLPRNRPVRHGIVVLINHTNDKGLAKILSRLQRLAIATCTNDPHWQTCNRLARKSISASPIEARSRCSMPAVLPSRQTARAKPSSSVAAIASPAPSTSPTLNHLKENVFPAAGVPRTVCT
jgi:hypothetical protein